MVQKEAVEDDVGPDVDIDADDAASLTSYTRRPEHARLLAAVFQMSKVQLLSALAIEKYSEPGYIPSEVLVSLMRGNFGGSMQVSTEIGLTLHKRLVSELGRFFHKKINCQGVLASSSEARSEAVSFVIERIFRSKVEVSFAEVSFGDFVKHRLLDWFKSQITLKNSAPSVDAIAAKHDEDGSGLSLTDQVVDEYSLNPEETLSRKQLVVQCRAALLTLTEKQRTAVMLVYYQDMTHKEAAGVMKLHESSVQKHLEKAIAALKRSLP